MDKDLLKKYAHIVALNAEVEGMKAANKEREMQGYSLAYDESAFVNISEEIKNLVK